MKVGYLTTTNSKGQIVIPKVLRDALAITPKTTLNIVHSSQGLYLYPIAQVMTAPETENTFISLLKSTQGSWADETSSDWLQQRRPVELAASRKRKQAW